MKSAETKRKRLIDKILSIRNEDFLKALGSLVSSSSQVDHVILTQVQKKMLEMSETDISAGRLISQDELDPYPRFVSEQTET